MSALCTARTSPRLSRALRAPARSRASARKGPSAIHGQGAFASRRILAGTIVTSMGHAIQTRDGASPGFPHDSVIHLASRGIVVRDAGWTSPHHKPTWYVINHSAAANLAARVRGGRGSIVLEWIALRDIERGEELLWRYQTGHTLRF